jgi:alkanesulfonate monooxygenase SsuD/methylene tetrahydromethanopterin reductase-like flavin-dependent oxidoreductase (luciferase family)
MKIGVQLPEVEREVRWPEYRDMALAAEQAGLDSIWLGDHLLYRTEDGAAGPWEAWSMLAGIAAVTEHIELGPLVAATAFHNPAMIAKKAATVDEISAGRLILGLGAGWNKVEFDAFGFPYDRRASRFEEAFTVIRTLLTAGHIDFDGEFYTLRDCELLPRPRPGGPPIMIGSIGERVLRATLPWVQSWNGWYDWFGNGPDGLAGLLTKIDEICREVDRDPATLEKTVTVSVRMPDGKADAYGSPGRTRSEPIPSAELAALLETYAGLGIDGVQLVVDPITVGSIERIGQVLAGSRLR